MRVLRCRTLPLLLSLLLPACSGPGERRTEIATGADDGCLFALNSFLPVAGGWAAAALEDCRVGTCVSGSGDTLRCRVLYRFDVSGWKHGDVTLHLRCAATTGSPGAVEVLCIDTFPALPDTMSIAPSDLAAWWDLAAGGIAVGLVNPVPNREFTFAIPESLVAAKSADGCLCFMLKLADETRPAGNWMLPVTFDYAVSHNVVKPWLSLPD
ncbi:MAG: hypothetical protein ABIK37_01000 [candidate division WOR-3 bacterium]